MNFKIRRDKIIPFFNLKIQSTDPQVANKEKVKLY